jgi:hypothetical protein
MQGEFSYLRKGSGGLPSHEIIGLWRRRNAPHPPIVEIHLIGLRRDQAARRNGRLSAAKDTQARFSLEWPDATTPPHSRPILRRLHALLQGDAGR